MTKVTIPEDCGNAPKMLILKNLNIAFAEGNTDFISDHITEDFVWNRVGYPLIEGKENCINAVKEFSKTKIPELEIKNIITHGKTGATNGMMKIENGSTLGFCNIYQFSGHDKEAKVKEMTTYVIDINYSLRNS